ncbi:MAG: ATP synthase subunit I [Niabella sp.]
MAQNKKNPASVMTLVFILISILLIILKFTLKTSGIDFNVLLTGNLILFVLGVFTTHRSLKAIDDPNPHAFVRSFYAGFLIRLAVCAAAAFVYIYMYKDNVNRGALFGCLAFYAIYSIIETATLRKKLHQKKQ